MLEWVSVYWFSRAGPGASLRIYKEMTGGFERPAIEGVKWTSIPLGFAYFPKELNRVPRKYVAASSAENALRANKTVDIIRWLQTLGNIVFESEHEHGGHFAAHEHPDELADDVKRMFGKGGPAFGVVPGKNGYA